jgi:hypothetical protein
VSMMCIPKLTRGDKHYGMYEADEGCEGYVDGMKGATSVE